MCKDGAAEVGIKSKQKSFSRIRAGYGISFLDGEPGDFQSPAWGWNCMFQGMLSGNGEEGAV